MSAHREEDLAELSALMRRHAETKVPPSVDQAGMRALEQRLRGEPVRLDAGRGAHRVRPLVFLAATLSLAAAVAFFLLAPRPLSYAVRGAPSDGPYISAPAGTRAVVEFSDGSSLEADPGSRLRVDEARVAGARVLVERGHANVHVHHQSRSAWNFVAGPFDVRVTGTRFDLSWDPATEAIDLRLSEGSVEVRSPFADAPIVVRAGQRFRADLGSRSMTVIDAATVPSAGANTPAKASESAASAPTTTGPQADEPEAALARGDGAAPHPSSVPVPSEAWSALVARGQFETVVAKAGERGTSDCESACSASDLKALADAARYTGRSAMAESALLSLRKRFGGSRDGRSAAFLLGRLEEARGATAQAGRWYDTYLRELPAGDLAAEALAGKMRTVFASEGRAAAESIATEYLARYPNGVHAQTARGIVAGQPRK
jgi:ferric-dicitrate binding protein FerR (iron transport regulator)